MFPAPCLLQFHEGHEHSLSISLAIVAGTKPPAHTRLPSAPSLGNVADSWKLMDEKTYFSKECLNILLLCTFSIYSIYISGSHTTKVATDIDNLQTENENSSFYLRVTKLNSAAHRTINFSIRFGNLRLCF